MRRRYWDAACFLAWLNAEPQAESCRPIIELAETGELKVVTSALTIAEVLYLRRPGLPREAQARTIEAFFEQEYILMVELDRVVVEKGRRLVWDRGIAPRDAIHIASAIIAEVEYFDTFDEGLIERAQEYPLTVGRPNLPEQLRLEAASEPPSSSQSVRERGADEVDPDRPDSENAPESPDDDLPE